MGSLIPVDDGPVARCKLCGKPAAGPCARCRGLVCGDCCELTEGGATTFAVCLACVKRGGKSLAGGWLGLLGWLGAIIVGLAAVAAALVLAGCGGGEGRHVATGGTGSSSRLAIADGYAYWFDPVEGLLRAPLDNPGAFARVTRIAGGDGNLHLNSTHVFWRVDAEVRTAPRDGGRPTVIGTTVAGVPFNLAVDDAFLYYSRDEELVRQSLVDLADTTTFLMDRTTTSLAVDGTHLYGTTCATIEPTDAIWRMPLAGADRPARIAARGCPEVATLDEVFVYMFDLVDQRPGIVRVGKDGGSPEVVFESASSIFAVRAGFLYAFDLDDRIVRVPLAAGTPTVVVAPDREVFGIAVDDTRLFYTQRNELAEIVLYSAPLPP